MENVKSLMEQIHRQNVTVQIDKTSLPNGADCRNNLAYKY
jgi:hypothetical protein